MCDLPLQKSAKGRVPLIGLIPHKSLSVINNIQGANLHFTYAYATPMHTHGVSVSGGGPYRATLPPGGYLAVMQTEEVFRKWTRQGTEGIEEKGGGKGASEGC